MELPFLLHLCESKQHENFEYQIFFPLIFLYFCLHFLTGALLGTFRNNHWFALFRRPEFTEGGIFSAYTPFLEIVDSEPNTRTKEKILIHLVLVHLTFFPFMQHFLYLFW